MSQYPATPMLDRLGEEKHKTEIIHDFLEWAAERHAVHLGQWSEIDDDEDIPFFYQRTGNDDLLAGFIGVDMRVVEQEKQALLDYVRVKQGIEA